MTVEAPLPDPRAPSPFPSEAELERAQRKVRGEGGRLVSGPHRGKMLRYEDKTKDTSSKKLAHLGRKSKVMEIETSGCGHEAQVEIPYDRGGRRVWIKACLICDGLFLSPNFSGELGA